MERSSSSKVTVEYHDPSGIFQLLQPNLISRTPLRSLNWKSPTRPLRNIDALHVDFVPDDATAKGASTAPGNGEGKKAASKTAADLWPNRPEVSGRSTSAPVADLPARERRHQIPGLRETPYLKLFILRCDDKDAYRAEHRQQLKEWVQRITPATRSTTALTKHDNHDAFEWMIIHVVIPDTQAATEPRWTAAKNDPDELAERSKSKTKWTSKGTSTVFDKLRADFHPSSKSALERVAQIRLATSQVPQEFLPKTPFPAQLTETAQEQENAWQDLVSKFKILILRSFDLRVTQYEEDIRERESQRSLPGWNFCTFFTSKEGLARGFESVGLVEDALAIYDELAVGLDLTTQDDTAILGDMKALEAEISDLATNSGDQGQEAANRVKISELLRSPLDLTAKDYRGLIVSSTISLFDFHTYIFARQRLLIYRLGSFEPKDGPTAAKPPQTSAQAKIKSEDQLLHVAGVCRRASAFISSNTRTLRKEMETIAALEDRSRYDTIVQSVAASWAFTISEKVLAETAVSIIRASPSPEAPTKGSFGFPQGANNFPSRRSSLRTPSGSPSLRSTAANDHERWLPNGDRAASSVAAGSGLAELAAARGQLCLLQRRFLEALALKNGWTAGWSTVVDRKPPVTSTEAHVSSVAEADQGLGEYLDADLLTALKSEEAFRATYEMLTDLAVQHLMLGSHVASVETLMGDLALLKYQNGDITGAAQIFAKIAPKYQNQGWGQVEREVLLMYTNCLKQLNRRDDYVRAMLTLLKTNAGHHKRILSDGHQSSSDGATTQDADAPVEATLSELLTFSNESSTAFKASFSDLFDDLYISESIQTYTDRDGFGVALHFDYILKQPSAIDAIKLKLVKNDDIGQELWLSTKESLNITQGTIHAQVSTNRSLSGVYAVRQVAIEMHKVHFIHTFEPAQKPTPFGFTARYEFGKAADKECPLLVVYPRAGSLSLRLNDSSDVYHDKPRSLFLRVNTGDLAYDEITLKLKPATAGLRLRIAESTLVEVADQSLHIISNTIRLYAKPGAISMIRIPYLLEVPQDHLLVKLEAICKANQEEYIFAVDGHVSTEAVLDVDVNDVFKSDALYSRFNIRNIGSDPVMLTGVTLDSSADYRVITMAPADALPLFEKQPVSFACKITKMDRVSSAKPAPLELHLKYTLVTVAVVEEASSRIFKALADSPHRQYKQLFQNILQDLLDTHLTPELLESSMLCQEFEFPLYQDLGWAKYLAAFPREARADLRTWLQAWHADQRPINLHASSLSTSHQRSHTVPVDIPTTDLLNTATLHLPHLPHLSSRLPPVATLGHPIPAELRIATSTHWAPSPPAPFDLTYTIADSPDWLVAGPASATFATHATAPAVFPLVLVPLVPGPLLLPAVEVGVAAGAARTGVTCETCWASAADAVLVVRAGRDAGVVVVDSVGGQGGGDVARGEEGGRGSTDSIGILGTGVAR